MNIYGNPTTNNTSWCLDVLRLRMNGTTTTGNTDHLVALSTQTQTDPESATVPLQTQFKGFYNPVQKNTVTTKHIQHECTF